MGATLCKESCHAFCETIINDNEKEKNSCPWYSTVDVDWNGCRKFPRLPPAGQHPRLFFTKQDIPRIVARFTHSEMAPVLKHILDCVQKDFFKQMNAHMSELCDEELESPTSKETIDMFFKSDDNRNVSILGAYVYGIIYEMPEIVAKAKRAAIFYAKVILRSKEIAHEQDLKGKPYNVWHSNFWDLSMGWLFGGSSLALAYDLMFNELSEDERAIMRNAFTTAVRNRRGWGMGWPTRRIQSNWASYHGDLLIISAVVEDEDGFDPEVFTLFSDLMAHYLDYAFYDSGHPMEDSYVLSLGFREGSLCFLVMALRGHNIFNHPRKFNVSSSCSIGTNESLI